MDQDSPVRKRSRVNDSCVVGMVKMEISVFNNLLEDLETENIQIEQVSRLHQEVISHLSRGNPSFIEHAVLHITPISMNKQFVALLGKNECSSIELLNYLLSQKIFNDVAKRVIHIFFHSEKFLGLLDTINKERGPLVEVLMKIIQRLPTTELCFIFQGAFLELMSPLFLIIAKNLHTDSSPVIEITLSTFLNDMILKLSSSCIQKLFNEEILLLLLKLYQLQFASWMFLLDQIVESLIDIMFCKTQKLCFVENIISTLLSCNGNSALHIISILLAKFPYLRKKVLLGIDMKHHSELMNKVYEVVPDVKNNTEEPLMILDFCIPPQIEWPLEDQKYHFTAIWLHSLLDAVNLLEQAKKLTSGSFLPILADHLRNKNISFFEVQKWRIKSIGDMLRLYHLHHKFSYFPVISMSSTILTKNAEFTLDFLYEVNRNCFLKCYSTSKALFFLVKSLSTSSSPRLHHKFAKTFGKHLLITEQELLGFLSAIEGEGHWKSASEIIAQLFDPFSVLLNCKKQFQQSLLRESLLLACLVDRHSAEAGIARDFVEKSCYSVLSRKSSPGLFAALSCLCKDWRHPELRFLLKLDDVSLPERESRLCSVIDNLCCAGQNADSLDTSVRKIICLACSGEIPDSIRSMLLCKCESLAAALVSIDEHKVLLALCSEAQSRLFKGDLFAEIFLCLTRVFSEKHKDMLHEVFHSVVVDDRCRMLPEFFLEQVAPLFCYEDSVFVLSNFKVSFDLFLALVDSLSRPNDFSLFTGNLLQVPDHLLLTCLSKHPLRLLQLLSAHLHLTQQLPDLNTCLAQGGMALGKFLVQKSLRHARNLESFERLNSDSTDLLILALAAWPNGSSVPPDELLEPLQLEISRRLRSDHMTSADFKCFRLVGTAKPKKVFRHLISLSSLGMIDWLCLHHLVKLRPKFVDEFLTSALKLAAVSPAKVPMEKVLDVLEGVESVVDVKLVLSVEEWKRLCWHGLHICLPSWLRVLLLLLPVLPHDVNCLHLLTERRYLCIALRQSDQKIKKHLIELLSAVFEILPSLCDASILRILLAEYSASLSEFDQSCLSLLLRMESYMANANLRPFMFGMKSENFYAENGKRLDQMNMINYLNLFDGSRLTTSYQQFPIYVTIKRTNLICINNASQIYDPKFVLLYLQSVFAECEVTEGIFSSGIFHSLCCFLLTCLSSLDENIVSSAADCVEHILNCTQKKCNWKADMINIFKIAWNDGKKERLPLPCSGFLATALTLVRNENDPCYDFIMKNLRNDQSFSRRDIPYMYIMLTNKRENFLVTQEWILTMMATYLCAKEDEVVLSQGLVCRYLCCFLDSVLCHQKLEKLIFKCLVRIARISKSQVVDKIGWMRIVVTRRKSAVNGILTVLQELLQDNVCIEQETLMEIMNLLLQISLLHRLGNIPLDISLFVGNYKKAFERLEPTFQLCYEPDKIISSMKDLDSLDDELINILNSSIQMKVSRLQPILKYILAGNYSGCIDTFLLKLSSKKFIADDVNMNISLVVNQMILLSFKNWKSYSGCQNIIHLLHNCA